MQKSLQEDFFNKERTICNNARYKNVRGQNDVVTMKYLHSHKTYIYMI